MKSVRCFFLSIFVMFSMVGALPAFSQEVNVITPEQKQTEEVKADNTAQQTTPAASPVKEQTFWDVVTHGGVIGMIIWILMFATSVVAGGLIIDGFVNIRNKRLMPPEIIKNVHIALGNGDMATAIKICKNNPSSLSRILLAGFYNVSEEFDEIIDYVSSAAEEEIENLMQRVNYLSLQSGLAPMLGLMGTVTGMIDAFAGLATASGAEKAQVLALAISQALYATAVGLLVAIPAIVCFTIIKNKTQKLIMRMERVTYDIIKNLKNVEVVVED